MKVSRESAHGFDKRYGYVNRFRFNVQRQTINVSRFQTDKRNPTTVISEIGYVTMRR